MLQVVNRLRCVAHLGGPGGSHHFCAVASCECPVLGKFMGRAPAAVAAAVQSLRRLWRRTGGPPNGRPGVSPTGKGGCCPPPVGARRREGAGPRFLPPPARPPPP